MKGKIFSFIMGVFCGIILLIQFQYKPPAEQPMNCFTDSIGFFPNHKIMKTVDGVCWFPVGCPEGE